MESVYKSGLIIMIINGDCLEVLRTLPVGKVKCIIADPPDNIGLKYIGYDDKIKNEDYYLWLHMLILEILPKTKIFWLTYYPKHDTELVYIIRNILKYRHPTFKVDKFLWRYTFSQYNANDCAYGYRPFIRFKRNDAEIYPEEIMEISQRQLLGDARANPAGRVPDNIWNFPRIVGNSWERVEWMNTQLPIELVTRIMKFSVKPNEIFIDLFAGSGSTLMTAAALNRLDKTHVIELDKTTCEKIKTRKELAANNIEIITFDDLFDGNKLFKD